MPRVGKKKQKKKKFSVKVGSVGLAGTKFAKSSFKLSDKFSLDSLLDAIPQNTKSAPKPTPRRYPEFYKERVESFAERFDPDIGKIREENEAAERRQERLYEDQLPFRSTPILESRSLPDQLAVLNPKSSDSLSRPLIETVYSDETVLTADIEKLPDKRYVVDEEGGVIEDYSVGGSGFRGSLGERSTDSSSALDPKERRYKRDDMDFWSGEILKNFARTRGVSVPRGVSLQKGRPEREDVLDKLFEGSRRKGIL